LLSPLSFSLPSPVIYFEDVKGYSKKEKKKEKEKFFRRTGKEK